MLRPRREVNDRSTRMMLRARLIAGRKADERDRRRAGFDCARLLRSKSFGFSTSSPYQSEKPKFSDRCFLQASALAVESRSPSTSPNVSGGITRPSAARLRGLKASASPHAPGIFGGGVSESRGTWPHGARRQFLVNRGNFGRGRPRRRPSL